MKTVLATLVCVFFVFLIAHPALCEPYFQQRERGWFWYESFPEPGDTVQPEGREGHITVEQIRKKGERLFETALLFPTRENVKAYMEHQKRVLERSERFSQVWKRVLWETPALDATVDYPVSAAGAEISRNLQRSARDEMIERISRVARLVFFFRSDCPFCRGQAGVIKTLERRHGIGVLAASLDGRGLYPLYPNFVNGGAQAARLGVDRVPALFLFIPSRSKIVRIGTGYLTLGEIRQRLHVVGEEVLGTGRDTQKDLFTLTGEEK
ncbi:MAG: conjugal transfer protein TraF [Candidatus Dadabacteria bacterium]|nr:conjugal transfer protein TraF [Candidatus Dadabacteria bacterium]MYA48777.1 conjugal transfer protein TraF [Candidatus Dadabacteria bacterium]MYF48278.1 conjugal transfer protein TraF [Candidatus Dadabacteria bacterium]MYG82411.1 conjugal transfer protein TraF [Candidatus Dadabacteria bacterium]MYK49347.1 conjugal transfer protein TraF [Candidatus Dadabacteria bacterium]